MAADESSETVEAQVERLVAERLKAQSDKEAKAKKLKEMGLTPDVLGAIADAVLDTFKADAEARAKEKEDADQSPSQGTQKRPGFLQSIGLVANDD